MAKGWLEDQQIKPLHLCMFFLHCYLFSKDLSKHLVSTVAHSIFRLNYHTIILCSSEIFTWSYKSILVNITARIISNLSKNWFTSKTLSSRFSEISCLGFVVMSWNCWNEQSHLKAAGGGGTRASNHKLSNHIVMFSFTWQITSLTEWHWIFYEN